MLDLPMPVRSAGVRSAGKSLLSLALMDARNHSLRCLTAYEQWLAPLNFVVPALAELTPPLWLLGHIAWYQERWVPRNIQRQRGALADPATPRLASIEPDSDRWYDPANSPPDSRWLLDLPDVQYTRRYLADTMDITLELLELVGDSDDELYFFRMALLYEDIQGEALVSMAQTLGLPSGHGLLARRTRQPHHEPLKMLTQTWCLGAAPQADHTGFTFDNECGAHDVKVQAFEIDAQPVSWAQYADFVDDGGYEDPRWWCLAGWTWKKHLQRRAPRHVEKMRYGVVQRHFGRSIEVSMNNPVEHVSWFEAQAWCRWAGRRLPTEIEWELAACSGSSQGFAWGQTWEWTASTFEPYPDFVAGPDRMYSQAGFGTHKVLRGASLATRDRLRHPQFRGFQLPDRDDAFCGFRSCSL